MSRYRLEADGASKNNDTLLEEDDDVDLDDPLLLQLYEDVTRDSNQGSMHTPLPQAGHAQEPSAHTCTQIAQQTESSLTQQSLNEFELEVSAHPPSTIVAQSVFAQDVTNTEQATDIQPSRSSDITQLTGGNHSDTNWTAIPGDTELTDSNARGCNSGSNTSDSDEDACRFLPRSKQVAIYEQLLSLADTESIAVHGCQFYAEKVLVLVRHDSEQMLSDARLIKLTGLQQGQFEIRRLARPANSKLTSDSTGPGNLVIFQATTPNNVVETRGAATVGAFAETETENCKFGMTAGHCREKGERVYRYKGDGVQIDKDDYIGTISEVIVDQGDIKTSMCDVALIELIPQLEPGNVVKDNAGSEVILSQEPRKIKRTMPEDLTVQKFCPRAGEIIGKIKKSQSLVNHMSNLGRFFGCIPIADCDCQTFHDEGESGVLVTTRPSSSDHSVVDGIGIVFARDELIFEGEQQEQRCSLACPLRSCRRRLRAIPKYTSLQLVNGQINHQRTLTAGNPTTMAVHVVASSAATASATSNHL